MRICTKLTSSCLLHRLEEETSVQYGSRPVGGDNRIDRDAVWLYHTKARDYGFVAYSKRCFQESGFKRVSEQEFLDTVKCAHPKADKVQAFESGIGTPETINCRCILTPNCKFIITPKYPKELLLLL